MSNVLAFPAATTRYPKPAAYWSTYAVEAVTASGEKVTLTYRALSADSAHCRARHDGYPHVKSVRRVVGS